MAHADPARDVMGDALFTEALRAKADAKSDIRNERYISVIDYRVPSRVPRYFLIDTSDMSAAAILVEHGKGSAPDHDGMADQL